MRLRISSQINSYSAIIIGRLRSSTVTTRRHLGFSVVTHLRRYTYSDKIVVVHHKSLGQQTFAIFKAANISNSP